MLDAPMSGLRVLVLGGTVFLGRSVTDALLARGHQVTHFHRGKSRPDDPRVETLRGDRTDAGTLARAFAARQWDAVVDTSGFLPQVVRLSAEVLRDKAGRYFYVSSVSAYADLSRPGYDEDCALFPTPDPLPDVLVPELYGPLKAACERVVNEVWGGDATIVRPGLIVGPHDPTDRFTYWPARIARGGMVMAPGDPARAVQFIDARDLALWMVTVLERNLSGAFNATGPERHHGRVDWPRHGRGAALASARADNRRYAGLGQRPARRPPVEGRAGGRARAGAAGGLTLRFAGSALTLRFIHSGNADGRRCTSRTKTT